METSHTSFRGTCAVHPAFRAFGPALLAMFAVACALFCGACSSSSTSAGQGLAASYFPLHVGDTWVYDYGLQADRITENRLEVTGTEVHNGKTYYAIKETTEGARETFTSYYRTEGARVYQYYPKSEEEEVALDFQAGKEDVEEESPCGYVRQMVPEYTIPLGTFRNCANVMYRRVEPGNDHYAPGIGLVESWWFRGHRVLRAAVIDGVSYGTNR